MRSSVVLAVMFWTSGYGLAYANACDYRPSELLGAGAAGVIGTAGGGVAVAGTAVKAAGFYTLTHSVTGATMLGATAGGTSAAGTVGIMGGTAGVIGTTAAIITAPATVIIGGAIAAGIGAFEGVCYYEDDRVTNYDAVLKIVSGLSASADPNYFRLVVPANPDVSATLFVRNEEGNMDEYLVENLYLVNGVLMNRDWGRNTVIGNVSFMPSQD